MDVSVVIVNWNTKDLLKQCLTSIFKVTHDVSFEVIIVDNGSTDGSQDTAKKEFPKVKLIENQDNRGFGKANNQGMKAAKGQYVFLLNSDAYLIENSLKKMLDYANSDSKIGMLAPQLLNEDKSIQQSVGFFPHLPQLWWWMTFIDDLPGGAFLKPYHVDHDSFYKIERQVEWVTGAAVFLPKKAIDEVGMFDENIFMYGEDVEWCYRIKKAGYKIIFSPLTKIVHIGRGSSGKINKNAFLGEYKGILYFYRKYKSPFSLQIARFFLKIGAVARFIIFSALGKKELAPIYAEAFKVA